VDVAVVYCRKSAESALATDVSFDNQETDCAKYGAEKGYRIGRVLKESHSGADLAGRPLIWEAIEEVRSGRAQVLLVRNYDRLARKPEHQGVILYEVEEKAGGRVESALEPYDAHDVMQRTMRGIMAVVAEAERLNAVARMERGKRYRAERGELMGSSNPLFGYAWADDVEGERTTYLVDTDTGPIVVRIFTLATTGHSLRGIARLLNAEKVLTPSQWNERKGHIGRRRVGTEWEAEMVARVIRERSYTGDGAAYRYQQVRTKGGKKTAVLRPEGGAIPLKVPALVSLEVFNAANSAVGTKDTNGRPPIDKEASWLRLHVYCGVCGSRMVVKRLQGTEKYKYECNKRDTCAGGNFSIAARLLDPYAYGALVQIVGMPEPWPLREKMIERLGLDKAQALVSMAEGYQAQLAEKRAELDTARRRARQTADDTLAQQFINDAEELNAAILSLEAEYNDAREQLDNFSAGNAWVDATLARIKAGIKDLENPTEADIRALPYEERRLLLAATGLNIDVFPQGWRGSRQGRTAAERGWPVAGAEDGRVVVCLRWLVELVKMTGEGQCPSHETTPHGSRHRSTLSSVPAHEELSRPMDGSAPRSATRAARAWSAGS
jgi:DNA invertase Pin-like site-specific DNA recombinase